MVRRARARLVIERNAPYVQLRRRSGSNGTGTV